MSEISSKTFVLNTLKRIGAEQAKQLQEKSKDMTGTEINAESDYIPDFIQAKQVKNMSQREIGFICKSSAGRVVKLIQSYDSDVYTDEPENLPSQWGFVWSTDPKKALPFIAISTSPYSEGECCTSAGKVYRSTIDNNVWEPTSYPQGWEEVGAIDSVIS